VPGQSHPYRVEVALPSWVLDGVPALRRWLLSYGRALRLEVPRALVEEQRQWRQRNCFDQIRRSFKVRR
jgi:hypothetical protein